MGGKTITRADIADVLHNKIGLSRRDSAGLVDLFFDEISEALISGRDVKLSGFGSFKLREKNGRVGRNPRTKEEAFIEPRTVLTFSPSPNLKDVVNKGNRKARVTVRMPSVPSS